MRKKGIYALPLLVAALLLGTAMPAVSVYAVGNTEDEQQTESETQTEAEIPESYYLPIESNSVDGWPAGPQVEAEAAVVMDTATGAFLYSKNMEAKEYPASITKIMTTLVAIENGDLKSKVKFSSASIDYLDPDSSRLWMEVGEKITLERALYGVMLASANDCANGVAEKVGGSIENFVQMMNDKAAELGCVNTHFTNTHGLHDENHYTCARDMAIITQAAMENEIFARIAGTVEYSYPKTNKTKEKRYFLNHQMMLYDERFYYEGCLGGKTGFTSDALNTLVTVAKRDGRKLICVVLRTNGSHKTFYESADLLDYGFENFTREKVPIAESKRTRAELLGVSYFGQANLIQQPVLKENVAEMSKSVKVSLPKEGAVNDVVRTYSKDGQFCYAYNGWSVASAPIKFTEVAYEIPKLEVVNKIEKPINETETETETEVTGAMEKAGVLLQGVGQKAQDIWSTVWEWIYANDVMMAIIGLILICALLPVLIVAYIRSRKTVLIRRQRKQEKEERVQKEEDIDSKSALEIEAEIRTELEKEKLAQAAAKEKEEARKREAEKAEREIKELEKVIGQKTESEPKEKEE